MLDSDRDKIHKIANHYSFKTQREILVEECAELIQAVQKLKRREKQVLDIANTTAMQNYIEELADVSIMIEQMIQYMSPRLLGDYLVAITNKLDRQLQRIREETQ